MFSNHNMHYFSPKTADEMEEFFNFFKTPSQKLDVQQLKASHSDVVFILTQLSNALNKFDTKHLLHLIDINNSLDIGRLETAKLKRHIHILCENTDAARNILRIHLVLLHLGDKSSGQASYDKDKIKTFYKELAMQPDGGQQFKKNLESIATRKIYEWNDFDKVGARQAALDMLAEIKSLSITQSSQRLA